MKVMGMLRSVAVMVIALSIASCSTMRTEKNAVTSTALTADRTYQIKVRSGNIALDRMIHDYASARFEEYLKLGTREGSNSSVEIVFSSLSRKGFKGVSAGYVTNVIYGGSWYTGEDVSWLNVYIPDSRSEITPGGILKWQNSTMTVAVKDAEGKILWEAHYNYSGALDPSMLYVDTADEAARLSLDRIVKQLREKIIAAPVAAEETQKIWKPSIALAVESPAVHASPVPVSIRDRSQVLTESLDQ